MTIKNECGYDDVNMKLSTAQKFRNFFKASKGFTLIELLVVIGILGILAAALIATIDPFEQLNKADDAKTINVLTEYQNALLRYYANKGAMPWNDEADQCLGTTQTLPFAGLTSASYSPCVTTLVQNSELKQAFTTATNELSKIYMSADAANNVTMCFLPKSKSQQRNSNAKFAISGAETGGCLSQTSGGTACYWCSR